MEDTDNIKNNRTLPLWSIEDDTFFHAQGLLNHSAGHGQYVFVTWNDNYLLNFVFKASTAGSVLCGNSPSSSIASSSSLAQNTMAKVRVMMPQCPPVADHTSLGDELDGEYEEIEQVMILEYNTLLLMRSGRVYYFSSVKSVHLVHWLKDVRCMANANHSAFSVIRCSSSLEMANNENESKVEVISDENTNSRTLLLEVYRDLPNLGKFSSPTKLLLHAYNITFDEHNLFKCTWTDECYLLNSFVINPSNRLLFNKLAQLGENFFENTDITILNEENEEKKSLLNDYQEVHLFSISCNLYMLYSEDSLKEESAEMMEPIALDNSSNYSIHLINSYQSPIKYIRVVESEELIIVLLVGGYMDLWYSSEILQGALIHRTVQLLPYVYFDYCHLSQTFYFVSFDRVSQVRIIREATDCKVEETHKAVAGMVACTWVEELQQLVCLSCNNIFYRLTFNSLPAASIEFTKSIKKRSEQLLNIVPGVSKDVIRNYEGVKKVYALNDARINEILKRTSVLTNLLRQPQKLQDRIEKEYHKQLLLSMATKSKLIEKLFNLHLEYHLLIPSMEYFKQRNSNCRLLNVEFVGDMKLSMESKGSDYCIEYFTLIFFQVNSKLPSSKRDALLALFSSSDWYLEVFTKQQSLQIPVTLENTEEKEICLIIKCSTNTDKCSLLLERFQLRLLTYVSHFQSYLLIQFPLTVDYNHSRRFQYLYTNCILNMMHENVEDAVNSMESSLRSGAVYRHKLAVDSADDWSIILKSLPEFLPDSGTIYFLGYIPLQLDYNKTTNVITIASRSPQAIFYFKVHCYLTVSAEHDTTEGAEVISLVESKKDGHQILATIMEHESNVERLCGLLTDVSSNVALHWETLRNIYDNLRRDPLTHIYR